MLENTPIAMHAPPRQLEGTRSNSACIAIKANRCILFVDPAEVVTVEAQSNYVLLSAVSGSGFLLRESISNVASKFLSYGFVRIHRSALINAAFVEEIHPCASGEYVLRVRGGREFHVSHSYKKNLHFITPLWLGTDGFIDD
jgi:two-component system LytT family response regulator